MRRFGEGEEIKGLDKMERKGFLDLELLRQKSNTYKMQDARSEYCEMSQKFRGRSHWKRTLILIDYDRSRGQTCFCHFRKMSRHRFDRLFFSDSQHVELWTLHHGTLLRQRMCSMNFMPQRCEWHFWLKHINICFDICSDSHCHYLAKVGNGTRSNYSESQGGASKTCSASLLSTELKWVIKLAIQSFYINWVFYVDGKCKMSGELR